MTAMHKEQLRMGSALLLICTNRTGSFWPVFKSTLTLVWGKEKKQKQIRQGSDSTFEETGKGKRCIVRTLNRKGRHSI